MQPVISNNKLETALSQEAEEHERRRTLETEEHEKDTDQPDKEAAKQPAKPQRADTARADGTRRA